MSDKNQKSAKADVIEILENSVLVSFLVILASAILGFVATEKIIGPMMILFFASITYTGVICIASILLERNRGQ